MQQFGSVEDRREEMMSLKGKAGVFGVSLRVVEKEMYHCHVSGMCKMKYSYDIMMYR